MNFTRLGFIMATLGSSIGLGHIWRFPYMAGESGGSAFVMIYVVLTIVIGIPILVGKMIIGNKTQKHVSAAFKELNTGSKHWHKAGIMIIGGPLILSFYAMVLGWTFYYLFVVTFSLPQDLSQSESMFNTLISDNIFACFVSFVACVFLVACIVSRGVKNGLEKCNLILMPLLFIIFIGLFFYAMTMDAFSQAAAFLFAFDVSKINPSVVIIALSQVFFSLSLGTGVIIQYSSVAIKGDNLLVSASWVALSGIVISLVAGLIIFTFLFNASFEPSFGPGMLFVSLPLVFGGMPYGEIISFVFFLAVLFAGITSAISMLEPSVAYLAHAHNISRTKSAFGISGIIIIIGTITILSLSGAYVEYLRFFDKTFFSWIDFITSAIIMPLGTLGAICFIAYGVKKQNIYKFARRFMNRAMFNVWYVVIKYIAPIVIICILICKFVDTFFFKIGVGL